MSLFSRRKENDVVIVGCPKTRITQETFKEVLDEGYENVPEGKWLFNLGNGNFSHEQEYLNRGYTIINNTKSIRQCVNKLGTLAVLNLANIPVLQHYDITTLQGRQAVRQLLSRGEIMVLRGRKGRLRRIKTVIGFNKYHKRYTYATVQENKRHEFRVIMLKGEVVNVLIKNSDKNLFKMKQKDCTFARVSIADTHPLMETCKKASRILDIDLCGIDILMNNKGRVKIIEVNSGNGMCSRTVKRVFKLLN